MNPDGARRLLAAGGVAYITREGTHGETWWHILEGGRTIMSGFEPTKPQAQERAAGIIRARGLPAVELR